jgi:hypothetical protein
LDKGRSKKLLICGRNNQKPAGLRKHGKKPTSTNVELLGTVMTVDLSSHEFESYFPIP